MAKRFERPTLFRSNQTVDKHVRAVGDALVQKTLNTGMKAINKSEGNKDRKVERKPNYLQVTEERMKKLGVIDLKPYYAQSKHRKEKKGGGWYVRVPIKRKARGMSRRMYDEVRSVDIGSAQRETITSKYLYDGRQVSDAEKLNYQPKSNNIEKRKTGNNRHSYTAFRTVSDKSPASSWIVNRKNINEEDTSPTFIKNVNRLMKWKMKNGWK